MRLNANQDGGEVYKEGVRVENDMMNCLNNQQLDFSLLPWEMSSGSLNSWTSDNYSPPLVDMSQAISSGNLNSWTSENFSPPLVDMSQAISSDFYNPFNDACYLPPAMFPMWLPTFYPQMQPMPLVRAEIRERSDNWTTHETNAMLTILIANKKKFDNIRRHPNLWNQLAEEMKAKGYPRTIDKCKNRWKVLVAKYKKSFNYVRDNLSHEPLNHPEHFEFFDQMSTLLHAKLTKGPANLIRKFKLSTI